MELPRRHRGDELLRPGEFSDLIRRLRARAPARDIATVVAYAFDHRTRMLPFIYADTRMAPAGVRAVASALVAAGFEKTRVVLQQWNPRFRPAHMRLDGRVPDLFLVSSMQIHSQQCRDLIRDCCRIDPAARPLIIAGGPKTIYEPWDVFNIDPADPRESEAPAEPVASAVSPDVESLRASRTNRDGAALTDPCSADVAVTGEEFVLLSLLEVVLECRGRGESLRAAFRRARDSGLLDTIPGLVYAREAPDGRAVELVDTGIQRLLADLDELPHPAIGYRLLEGPSRATGLAPRALEPHEVRSRTPIASLVMTFGCKFACPYCPIPAYNQRQHRLKSPERLVDEMTRIRREFGIKYFFGTDDNFFNDHQRTLDIVETMARSRIDGRRFYRMVHWGTEVTVHDTLALKNHLKYVRAAGVQMLWLGVEDMTATFVKKGQSVSKTQEAFQLLRRNGIAPMPMMMHHDTQPLYTPGSPYGLLNQARLLWKSGAPSLQVLMMTPATGSKLYEEPFNEGLTIDSVAGRRVEPYMMDANYVVATAADKPWRKQINIILTYLWFYNPLRLLRSVLLPRDRHFYLDVFVQLIGIWGVTQTIRRTLGWALRLRFGAIRRRTVVPRSPIPMRSVSGGPAGHDLPAPAPQPAQQPALVQLALPKSRPPRPALAATEG